MKKFLTILTIAIISSISSYASKNTYLLKKQIIEDKSLKITIDLGNITKFSEKDIDEKVRHYTTNFLANSDASKYNIIIKANIDPKQIKDIKLDAISFQVEIKGTLTEVKKELKNIAQVINDLKKSEY
jgi:hypothetical protein